MKPPRRSPYREAAAPSNGKGELRSLSGNRELVLPLGLLWCVSALRVVYAVIARETFDVGATLAVVAVLAIPVAVVRALLGSRHPKDDIKKP